MSNIKDHVLIETIEAIVEEAEEGSGVLPFGEANTASNYGTEGEGFYDSKDGIDLRFKNLKVLNGLSLTPNETNHTLELGFLLYDNRSSPYSTGSIAGSGGTDINEFAIGAFDKGTAQAVAIEKTAGASDDITIQIYDSDPDVAGVVIYEVPNFDIDAENLDDRNIWFLELAAVNSLWLKITNDGSTAVTLDVGIRIKGE